MNLTWDKVSGIIRHALTFGGGFLVAKGIVPEGMLEEAVGALMTIIGIIWSYKAPEKNPE
jgi:hypothetical protein